MLLFYHPLEAFPKQFISFYAPLESYQNPLQAQKASRLSLKAFPITDTELTLIAAPAIIGLKMMPKNGYKTPAAIGTPKAL